MKQEDYEKAGKISGLIREKTAELEKVRAAFGQLSVSNPVARTELVIVNPGRSNGRIVVDPLIYPEAEFILEYIKRLEAFIADLNTQFERL